MNYTKGEWIIKETPNHATESEGVNFMEHTDEYQITAEDGVTCIAVMGTAWASGQAINNAHLIAAAPDMYEALGHLINSYEFHCPEAKNESEALKIAKAAKAKAEGKGNDERV